ncbi:hypothetical protein BKA70DRAFT_1554232 [Coprinopsis sp. MPI-PUGE-AT-0042]|nr:hypothetical protein BKA70DRAFT_1554232 [Coprinopsis sp. MPI-PUGE-AT-0042]
MTTVTSRRRRGRPRPLYNLRLCSARYEDGTLCDQDRKPGNIEKPEHRCERHSREYYQSLQAYKAVSKEAIRKEGRIPSVEAVKETSDLFWLLEVLDLLEKYRSDLKSELTLRNMHTRRFISHPDEGHRLWCTGLEEKIYMIDDLLEQAEERRRKLVWATTWSEREQVEAPPKAHITPDSSHPASEASVPTESRVSLLPFEPSTVEVPGTEQREEGLDRAAGAQRPDLSNHGASSVLLTFATNLDDEGIETVERTDSNLDATADAQRPNISNQGALNTPPTYATNPDDEIDIFVVPPAPETLEVVPPAIEPKIHANGGSENQGMEGPITPQVRQEGLPPDAPGAPGSKSLVRSALAIIGVAAVAVLVIKSRPMNFRR